MSSSNSKSRNFRRRLDDEDSSSADPSAASVPSPPTARRPQPPSSSASKPKKLLSFADDEGDEGAVTPLNHSSLSKSSSSSSRRKPPPPSSSGSSSRLGRPSSAHKLTASRDRAPLSSSATTSNVLPQAGTYTKEAILELQKNTRTLAKPSPKPSPSSEPRIILRGLLKPAAPSPNQTQTHPNSVIDDDDDDNDDGDVADANTRLASIGLMKSASHDDYPDPETIRKIRAEREKKRQSRASAADFIPLNGPSHTEAEGSSDDDELELRTRVAMVGKKESKTHGVFEDVDSGTAASARYMNAQTSVNEIADEVDDEDEEDKIWEEEQFRKALGKRMDDGSATTRVVSGGVGGTNAIATMQQQPPLQHRASSAYSNIGGGLGASQRLDTLTIQQQSEIALKALQDNSRKLQESHDRTVSTLAKTDENLSASLDNITSLEASLSAAGEKFIFMQSLRDFVSVLCEFLQHKAPFIEELEERMQKVQEKRAAAVLERRSADNDDEMVGVEAAVKAAMSVFRERGNTAMMIATAASAAQTASASVKEQATQPELDELGRDMSRQKNMEMKRRAEARQRRRSKFDSKRFSCMEVDNSDQKIEGESSTDESESESEAYRSSRDMCLQTAGQILSDASEEFSQLQLVKERLENWKIKYAASYRDAYMSLSIPALFSPYVRLELLQWDPLHKADFSHMKWHSLLFDYGLPEGASDLNPDDADSNLVPQLVEKVAIPKLHHQIVHCWDTLSTLETENAVAATSLVIDYVPASSQALAELLVAIRTRLADAVADIMVPNWGSLVLKAVPSAAQVAAYRFGVSVRLIRNICLWKDILALPVLEELALDELLRRKVLPHVQSISLDVHDAVARTERIVASLTGVWAGPNVTGDRSGKLQSVVDFVVSLGRALEKKQAASRVSEGESNGLARRLTKLLVELNDYDNARGVAKTFRLKDAL